jgi:hypothetical protein
LEHAKVKAGGREFVALKLEYYDTTSRELALPTRLLHLRSIFIYFRCSPWTLSSFHHHQLGRVRLSLVIDAEYVRKILSFQVSCYLGIEKHTGSVRVYEGIGNYYPSNVIWKTVPKRLSVNGPCPPATGSLDDRIPGDRV